jgi:hypothetical protein
MSAISSQVKTISEIRIDAGQAFRCLLILTADSSSPHRDASAGVAAGTNSPLE